MKRSRKEVVRKASEIPQLRFEDKRLTSFAGLVVFQKLFQVLQLKTRFSRCLAHQGIGKAFSPARLFLQLVVHLLLGFRELRHADYYRDDPLVQRLVGFDVMPDVGGSIRSIGGSIGVNRCHPPSMPSALADDLGSNLQTKNSSDPFSSLTLFPPENIRRISAKGSPSAVKKAATLSPKLKLPRRGESARDDIGNPPWSREKTATKEGS